MANPDFQMYMQRGDSAFLIEDWRSAVDAYSRALQLEPENPDAHMYLGLSLMNDGQLERALKVYKRANQLSPDDPLPLETAADVLERMGRLKEAAQQYVTVADLYLNLRDWNKAIDNWEHATALTPGLVSVHVKLAQAFERIGDTKKAVREYLVLAYNFRRVDDIEKATKAVERALKYEPNNAIALNVLQSLKSGGEVILPDTILNRPVPKPQAAAKPAKGRPGDDMWELPTEATQVEDADPRGPIGEALHRALGILAEYVVEGGLNSFAMHAMQAMEFQRQNLDLRAIEGYQQSVKAGLNHPSLKLCLGGLLVLNDQPKEALKYLGEAILRPELAAGALHGTGLAHHKLGDQTAAARYLIQSLQAVDTQIADPNEMSELNVVYDSLIIALEGRSKEALSVVNERFIGLLSGKDWKRRIPETRRHLEETLRDEGDQGLVDFLVAKNDELADSVTHIDRYIRSGLYTLAMDEAHRAVERSPFYLPVHVRMAEIMMREGRIRQAIDKYNMVARAFLVRGENDRAAAILGQVLEMAPLDIVVRMNLIELLEGEDRMEEAFGQYAELADTYQQLGDFEKALETYSAAERLGKRIQIGAAKLVELKHAVADLHQVRFNLRQAQRVYEEIVELSDSDEKALRALADIYYRQNNSVEAIKRLDQLLGIYAKRGQVPRLMQMLEEFVKQYPKDTALRARLASIYRKMSQSKEAIEQLDALGELQLDAGLNKDAANTIRQIIALNPDNVDDYKRLLAQLSGL